MMLESMPYEQYKNLSYDERMKYELAELQNGIDIRDNIIDEKEKTINEKDKTISEKDKEILRLQNLLEKNDIDF